MYTRNDTAVPGPSSICTVSAEYLSYLLNNSSYVQNADSKSASRAGHAKNIYLLCDKLQYMRPQAVREATACQAKTTV